jgi:hypothetical protein
VPDSFVYACLPGPFAIASTDRGLLSLYPDPVTAHAFGQLSALLSCLVGWSDGADTVGSTFRMDLAELKHLASVKQLRSRWVWRVMLDMLVLCLVDGIAGVTSSRVPV